MYIHMEQNFDIQQAFFLLDTGLIKCKRNLKITETWWRHQIGNKTTDLLEVPK